MAAVAAIVVVGAGMAMARAVSLPGPRPILDGERMQIHVVAPVEPEIAPGSVMEVGELVDGFEYRPPPAPVIEPVAYAPWDEYPERPEPRPAPRRYAERPVVAVPPSREEPTQDWREGRGSRWFGFDAPERDYRAEREARRARIDARLERDRERREVRWYRSDGEPVSDDGRDDRRRRDEDLGDLRG